MTDATNEMPRPKDWIAAIHPYVPGKAGSGTRPVEKLSANENPLGCSPRVAEALASPPDHARYPDPAAHLLRGAIAAKHGIDPALIVCGTGSDELLTLIAQGYAGPGDEIIHMQFGFAVYEIATRKVGAEPVIVPAKDYGTDVDGILAAVTPRTRLVYVANPNNPTGTLASSQEIARLHAGLPGDVVLVLDQAYAEYLAQADDDGGLDLAAAHANVLVTRTFSKIYGLAAERIGWATGAPQLIDTLNRIRGPFNVTATGQVAALAALDDENFVQDSRAHNLKWRHWLGEELGALGNHGVSIVPSQANFLLVRFDGAVSAEEANRRLAEAGYIVRWLPGQGLPDELRITIGTEAATRGLAEALRRIVSEPEAAR